MKIAIIVAILACFGFIIFLSIATGNLALWGASAAAVYGVWLNGRSEHKLKGKEEARTEFLHSPSKKTVGTMHANPEPKTLNHIITASTTVAGVLMCLFLLAGAGFVVVFMLTAIPILLADGNWKDAFIFAVTLLVIYAVVKGTKHDRWD